MLQLILAGIGFSAWALYIIIVYYSLYYSNINHAENASQYGGYLLSVILIYGAYKVYSIFFSEKKMVKYSFWNISLFALIHLVIICIAYTGFISSGPISTFFEGVKPSSIVLTLHVLSLLIFPIILAVIMRSLGFSVLSFSIKDWGVETLRFRFPIEITLGFFIFSVVLLILGHFSWYNLTGLIVTLIALAAIGYKGLIESFRDIKTKAVVYDNHNFYSGAIAAISPKLLTAEIAFIMVTFLINVSLINAIRPMPIGWDDLGAYMNFPKIMALTGEYILGAGMYPWQMITGTGYLFSYTASQAFYINQLGGILAVIVLTCALSLIFEIKQRKYLISLPIILATVFYAMPMNIFQQAKDMKLDPALLFMSIGAFMALFYSWKEGNTYKKNISYTVLAGILVGFVFTVKFTSIMLILAGLGFIAYRKLKIGGFFGFFFLFLAIFTKFEIWRQMNVWLPSDQDAVLTATSIVFALLSLAGFGYGYLTEKGASVKEWAVGSGVFILGVLIGTSPWLIKNLGESALWNSPSVSMSSVVNGVLNGSGGNFIVDYGKVYTPEEFKARQDAEKNASITSDGKSLNEDFGRYFGYEKGTNNYLKLVANLTFQKNQPGEFTDITFIYLAFIPAILLFIRGRRNLYPIGIAVLLTTMFLYYFTAFGKTTITDFFGTFELPVGYLLILVFNVVFLLASYFGIDETDENKTIKEIILMLGIYGFLFWISAFGIVWYGILVYFLFLALIGLASMRFTSYTQDEENNDDLMYTKVTLTAVFVIFIFAYFIRSAFPHGWTNLQEASYNEFKYNILNQEESIFAYRQDYVMPIATLNLADVPAVIKTVQSQATSKDLKELFTSGKIEGIDVRDFSYLLFSISRTKNTEVAKDAKTLANSLFQSILYPTKDIRNDGGIYRIGTFMTYLIDRNRQRFFDDSLIFGFETYFYDESPEATIDRMKKMGFKYLLVDLNAATIDKDPRHALTIRFEHLLHTMKARNLKFVDSDSLCLRFAIDMYKNGELQNPNDYIDVAGTNYESYRTNSGSEVVISRNQKMANCFNTILRKIYAENGIEKYPYLASVKETVDAEGAYGTDAASQQKLQKIFGQYFSQSWFALFEIYDAPKLAEPLTPEVLPTASGTTVPPIESTLSGAINSGNVNTGIINTGTAN